MRTTAEGIALIKRFEGCELTAYPDPISGGDPWTIGYGCTHGVTPDMMISQDEAEGRLLHDIAEMEAIILRLVHVNLSDNQLSALVSFVFNVGMGEKGVKDGFRELKNGEPSTLLTSLNQGLYLKAADEFEKWCSAGGRHLSGLSERRRTERELFLKH